MKKRNKKLFLLILATVSNNTPGLAHDAQRVKYLASVHIDASPEKVWALIGHFGDLSWDTMVKSVTAHGGDKPDTATRTVILASGGVLPDEQLERYEPDRFTYATFLPHVDVRSLPVTNYSSILVVLPEAGGGSRVEWRSAFYRGYPNMSPPPELNEAAATKAVAAMTQPALDGLKARMESGPPTQ